MASIQPVFLSGRRRRRFEALQRAMVPRSGRFSAAERELSVLLVDGVLAAQPARTRRQLGVFLLAVDLYAVMRTGRPLARLGAGAVRDLLGGLSTSGSARIRRGVDGTGTMAKLGVYGQPELASELGYRLRENPDDR
ncbi:MAG TPA: hypothetical protein VFA86_09280 [Gammaproteobacteria bacterium]|nr:hypothetical protein [Gammaproteobacteria bacterium]